LKDIDVIIGADICFWYTMYDSLKKLISRALHEGVQLVAIAAPERPMFDNLGEHFIKKRKGEILDWAVQCPHPIEGRILKIGPFSY